MTSLAHAYYLVLLAYAAFYAAVYLLPLARAAARLSPGESLKRLADALGQEHRVLDAEWERHAAPTPAAVFAGDGAPAEEGAPAEAEPEEDAAPHRRSTERLLALPALRIRYDSPLVQEAVDQIRVQYPGGAYQHVALDRLPSFSAYAERLASARTMAGLFVLLGLLLTMIRLDGVVDQIGAAAAGVSMTPDDFLASMGSIMTGVGGAFLSSIWGLALMLGFLLVVALIDRRTQSGLNAAETAFAGEVVPQLADLHTRLMPDLTLGDLLAETGRHLRTLNHTVDGMTDGMARSLAGLGERIETVLRDFGTFQDQYVQLNDLLKYIREASENLSRTTRGLEGAAQRLANPLEEFNQNVLVQIETVAEAVAINREGYATTAEQLATLGAHDDALLMEVRNLVASRLGEHAQLQEAAVAAVLQQAEQTDRQLQRVADGLEKAGNVRLDQTLSRLDEAVARLGRRHDDLQVPPSLFAWVATMVRRVRRDGWRGLRSR